LFPAGLASQDAPARKTRLKTYASQSGYVYEYFFEREQNGRYAFRMVSPSVSQGIVEIVVQPTLGEWERKNRGLRLPERYGIAKLALFEALDSIDTPGAVPNAYTLSGETLERIAQQLDLL